MAPATATEDPIVAIYPVPGELDEKLPPVPVRLERAEAKKAVERGAFSYKDASQAEAAKGAA